jgi:hypothetical protein
LAAPARINVGVAEGCDLLLSVPANLKQKPAQVIRGLRGLEHSVFFGGECRQSEFIFQMKDQILDIGFFQTQLHQAGVFIEVTVFQQTPDEPMHGGTHGSSSHGRNF